MVHVLRRRHRLRLRRSHKAPVQHLRGHGNASASGNGAEKDCVNDALRAKGCESGALRAKGFVNGVLQERETTSGARPPWLAEHLADRRPCLARRELVHKACSEAMQRGKAERGNDCTLVGRVESVLGRPSPVTPIVRSERLQHSRRLSRLPFVL